ncbi:MAG: hypothetical protein ACKO01_10585, partial [Erythrobacter sp.]
AIRKHAWTFVGAGDFAAHGAWAFTIDRTAARDAIPPPDSLFAWYAAVFTRLYGKLVAPGCTCRMAEPREDFPPHRAYAITRDGAGGRS